MLFFLLLSNRPFKKKHAKKCQIPKTDKNGKKNIRLPIPALINVSKSSDGYIACRVVIT